MTENQFNQKLVGELRKRLPRAVIFKHADLMTEGMPDFSVTFRDMTTWFEVKLVSNKDGFRPIQLATLRRLGRGMCVLWDSGSKYGWVWPAAEIYMREPMEFDFLVTAIMNYSLKRRDQWGK